ncbi:MAG: glycine cleavage system aminomethyltransferase GcvT [Cyclobacteriaceae bacterium]
MDLKRIPLHEIHVGLGAKIVPFAGFEMPVRYSSDKEEHLAVRNDVGVFDVSHMGEFMVSGPKALETLQWISSNDLSKLSVGQAQYGYLPNDKGGVVDDFITYKMGEEEYMLVVNASNIEKDWTWITSQNKGATLKNISEDIVLLAVQGPKASDTLQKLTDADLSSVKYYHFIEDTLAGKKMIISATGYTGAGGFELYIRKEDAREVWKAIFEAGAEFNILPIGLGARDTLRLEMGFCLYGNDIDEDTSPIAAGLGWVTKFTKDFINADQLKKDKEEGTEFKLVGLEIIDKGIPRHGYRIVDDEGNIMGLITSGSISPVTNKGIALGYIKTGLHKPGTEVNIEIRNKNIKSKVVKTPFI